MLVLVLSKPHLHLVLLSLLKWEALSTLPPRVFSLKELELREVGYTDTVKCYLTLESRRSGHVANVSDVFDILTCMHPLTNYFANFLGKDRNFPPTIYPTSDGTKNANRHLRGVHKLIPDTETPIDDDEPDDSVASQLIHQPASFSAETFRWKLLRCIAVLHLPFSIVEHPEFRDLFLYAAPRLRGNDYLPKSGSTVKAWMLELFLLQQAFLIIFMTQTASQIHLSFDLWTSSNHYCMLGVVAHFIDKLWINRTVLLALIPVKGSHAGVNIGAVLVDVIKAYSLTRLLGFCVTDNAGDNDTSLVALEFWLLTQGVIWHARAHRLRCIGHIINLVANAFTANRPLKVSVASRRRRVPGALPVPKAKQERPVDCITKLHEIIKFITAPGQRLDEFMTMHYVTFTEMMKPIQDNDTRWFSIFLSLERAIKLKDTIDLFVARNLEPKYPGAKGLSQMGNEC